MPTNDKIIAGFHTYVDRSVPWLEGRPILRPIYIERSLRYAFSTHYHPWAAELVKRLVENENGLDALEAADTDDVSGQTITGSDGNPEPKPVLYQDLFWPTSYAPT